MTSLIIDDIEIWVQKKKIKNIYLRVAAPQGRVQVSAPKNMKDEAIKMFLISKMPWIKKHKDKYKNQPKQCIREYVSGESVYLWGKKYALEVLYSNKQNNIKINGDRLILQVRENSTVDQREKLLNEWYRENIKSEIPEYLEKWQKIIGVTAEEWGVKNMKTRWGTCNVRDKRIWLNLQLTKKPPKCLEYVIVHELVHLLEKNHNNIFIGYMDKFMPNWRIIKKELNTFIED
ncbi:putative metal-dependent hydrolase [Clostridium pascui]|uniref:YgjP-like metallopeptidase domain-containing protein n=1 Tax=Clostridium pascui TaxID=46609 RepID=UPI00195A55B4|nr:putative metal-dependent hydrolase [Clostridium pascui]